MLIVTPSGPYIEGQSGVYIYLCFFLLSVPEYRVRLYTITNTNRSLYLRPDWYIYMWNGMSGRLYINGITERSLYLRPERCHKVSPSGLWRYLKPRSRRKLPQGEHNKQAFVPRIPPTTYYTRKPTQVTRTHLG